ncbi:hypothetical protein AB0K09_02515 [Streptomyces sp. NPDC049577]|uniref:hypothetical protein n=1 Tax=Streptomyces sp. NPDC049577 TaxID=3155153 RepID=UPI00343DEB66
MAATEARREESPEQGRLVRVTVNLTERTYRALLRSVEITGHNKTDTINRALHVNAWMEDVLRAGGNIYVEETPGAELQKIKII